MSIIFKISKLSTMFKKCRTKYSNSVNLKNLKISKLCTMFNISKSPTFSTMLKISKSLNYFWYKNSTLSKFFSNSELKNKVWRPKCLKYLKCTNLKIVHNVQNLKILNLFMCNWVFCKKCVAHILSQKAHTMLKI